MSGFLHFFGLFLIVFSAYIVDNLSGFVAMHGTFVLFGMRDETAKLDYCVVALALYCALSTCLLQLCGWVWVALAVCEALVMSQGGAQSVC